jgi:hypothetical protein
MTPLATMTIDADVLAVAKDFGLDPWLLQAVVNAEGNIVRAVQCSIPTVTTRAVALQITARSCVHAMVDWIKSGPGDNVERRGAFIAFWANRWAPRGAANDPHDLNANWASNVQAIWNRAMADG